MRRAESFHETLLTVHSSRIPLDKFVFCRVVDSSALNMKQIKPPNRKRCLQIAATAPLSTPPPFLSPPPPPDYSLSPDGYDIQTVNALSNAACIADRMGNRRFTSMLNIYAHGDLSRNERIKHRNRSHIKTVRCTCPT